MAQKDWWKENRRAVVGLGIFGVLFLVNLIVRFFWAPAGVETKGLEGVITSSTSGAIGALPGAGGIASGAAIGEAELQQMEAATRDLASLPHVLRLPSGSVEITENPPQRDPFRWGLPIASSTELIMQIPIENLGSGTFVAPPEMISWCRSGKRIYAFVQYQKTMYFLGQHEPLGMAPFRLIELVSSSDGTVPGAVLEWADRTRTVAQRRAGDEVRIQSIVGRLHGQGGPLRWPIPEAQEQASPSAPVSDKLPVPETLTAIQEGLAAPLPASATWKAETLGMASLPPLLPSEPLSISKLIASSSRLK